MKKLYDFYKKITKKYHLQDKFPTIEIFKTDFVTTFSKNNNRLIPIEINDEIAVILTVVHTFDWAQNPLVKVTIYANETVNSKNITTKIHDVIDELILTEPQVAVSVFNDEFAYILQKYDRQIQLNSNAYRLRKKDIDVNKFIEINVPQYFKIQYFQGIPDELIQAYCDFSNLVFDDMPDKYEPAFVPYELTYQKQIRMNENNAKNGNIHHCVLLFDDEKIIGMTNVSQTKGLPFLYQFMFGIHPDYRGKGLGCVFQSVMYDKLYTEVGFEEVLVYHHPKNLASIRLSEWLGFEFAHKETTYIVRNLT